MDVSDGPGVRVAIYTQGCAFHCPGCHNESIWDFNGGTEFTAETINKIIALCNHDYIAGLSILGGEPLAMSENITSLLQLCTALKEALPDKTIWMWTGFTFEEATDSYGTFIDFWELMKTIDVLVDGPWKQELFDPNLQYAGSTNQRVIDVKKTLATGEITTL